MPTRKRLPFFFLVITLIACNNQPTDNSEQQIGNPTAEEILADNENADIFVLNNIVYSNAEDIEWVKEQDLTLGEKVAEINKQTSNSDELNNYAATQLAVGTDIHAPIENSGILIVIVDGEELRYLGLVEG
ncbi:hypothetical protein [Gracilibacillus massiliensis]|uniref:hypothetical protein n=1 Tax=Gracilibacillus massiliensis TaxID=1564956 RepID=UPI00071D7B2B|nr:hypothetical protein [Gracilibacillus massiliensis]